MNGHICPLWGDWDGWVNYVPDSDAIFTHPAETIVYGDGTQIGAWGYDTSANFCWWGRFPEGDNDPLWKLLDRDLSASDWDGNNWDWTQNQGYGQVRYRHNMTASFVFADGHVRAIRRGLVKVPYNWFPHWQGRKRLVAVSKPVPSLPPRWSDRLFSPLLTPLARRWVSASLPPHAAVAPRAR